MRRCHIHYMTMAPRVWRSDTLFDMKIRILAMGAAAAACAVWAAIQVPVIPYEPGDRTQPLPRQVTPGGDGKEFRAGAPPSDAVMLLDGTSLDGWQHKDGKPADWLAAGSYVEVKPKSGDIQTKRTFGDCQLHVEWATPAETRGTDQEPGNSGVFLASLYEIQVLDTYRNKTYPDGQAGAVYSQYPPLVNATLPPGAWQTYDIVFHGPRFSASGDLTRLATVTVLHNGVLVQDHVTLTGPTEWVKRPPYKAHPVKMPLLLQDHGEPVRYRNIWIREIPDGAE